MEFSSFLDICEDRQNKEKQGGQGNVEETGFDVMLLGIWIVC